MPAIEFISYHNLLPGPLIMHNTGHSLMIVAPKLNADGQSERLPYIFGGKLTAEYEFEGLHFHWGDINSRGSEHTFNGVRYPMEMHLVHRNKKYKNMDEAQKNHDGLCVVAFFYQITDSDGAAIEQIVPNLSLVRKVNSSVSLNSTFTLASLLGPVNVERFYTYKGSLTTPPCCEAVKWVIFTNMLSVSGLQVNEWMNTLTSWLTFNSVYLRLRWPNFENCPVDRMVQFWLTIIGDYNRFEIAMCSYERLVNAIQMLWLNHEKFIIRNGIGFFKFRFPINRSNVSRSIVMCDFILN